jgi:GT2 family glycosyltransferase
MPELSLSILVTNYNTWDLTRRCVEQCLAHDRGNFGTLLVYDDCSPIKSAESFPPEVTFYQGNPNLGLTKALNRAFQMLTEDIVVLFDSDAYPTTPFCEDIRTMFEQDPELGLVAFQTVGKSGNPTESYTTEPNVWSLLLGQALYAKLEDLLCDDSARISVFTCAMAVRRSAFVELNGFDENFDWLDLDHDFSMRINRSHWKTAIADKPRAFHEGGGTPQLTRNRLLRFYKTRWYLLKKFNRIPHAPLVKAAILLRLRLEYLILVMFGRILFPDARSREDKIEGRCNLIDFCSQYY